VDHVRASLAAAGILTLCGPLPAALASSVTQPGSTVGSAVGAPLPEGFYFANTASWGVRDPNTGLFVDHPVFTWSTPWTFLGARFQALAEVAFNSHIIPGQNYASGQYNPLLAGQLAWDLGNGWGFSYTFGGYFEVYQPLAWSSPSINQRFALSYTGDGWNLTANVIYGIQLDSVTGRPQTSACPAPFAQNGCNPDFLNVDLTATKKFDKWELGPVAFGSADLNGPIAGYAKQSQFAAGGLVGYDFGRVRLQAYLTRDVYERNYGGRDTRLWGRVTVPLWAASAAASTPSAIVRKH
jgi:hypothetical protein